MSTPVLPLVTDLGPGETEVLALALESTDAMVILDDALARQVAAMLDIRFRGAGFCRPAPGVMEALTNCDAIIIGPSNPILSIWPILAVPGVADTIASHQSVVGISPLIGGTALKGPAHKVLQSLGVGSNTAGIISAYDGLLTDMLIDQSDVDDVVGGARPRIHLTDTRMPDLEGSVKLAQTVVNLASSARRT